MSDLAVYLARYGQYHRDRRNVATHLLGIPMIVLAVEVLLSRPVMGIGDSHMGLPVTAAMVLTIAVSLFYLILDLRFGLLMTALLIIGAGTGLAIASLPTVQWLGWGAGLFIGGWIIQFVGHAFEGRKPAFMDDLRSLLIGPLFVLAEVAFMLGLRRCLQAEIMDWESEISIP